jgi:hypothetical protein
VYHDVSLSLISFALFELIHLYLPLSFVVVHRTQSAQRQFFSPANPNRKDALFGSSIAIASTGGYMVVGEKGYLSQAYVYVELGDTWSLTDTLVGSGDTGLGHHVAAYDDTIVLSNANYEVSAAFGSAFVYKLISGE